MPTPASGTISLNDIGTITKGASGTTVSLNDANVRTLLGVASGPISLSQGYGKPVASSTNYTTPGTYTYIVPVYQYLTADVRGASGGGGGQCWLAYYDGFPGTDGSNSTFASSTTVLGERGRGGLGQSITGAGRAAGANGAGSGGTVTSAGGPAGGASGYSGYNATTSGWGGWGGKSVKTWTYASTSGFPAWGASVTATVGIRGSGGAGGGGVGFSGSAGSNGAIYMSSS